MSSSIPGVLRLRECFALRSTPSAQDDRVVKVGMRDHEYFAYIVCSRSGTFYIGMTNSIYRRALQHKRGEVEGFASKYHCDRLVYYESFGDVHKAIGRGILSSSFSGVLRLRSGRRSVRRKYARIS
jgi:hypothetical protein